MSDNDPSREEINNAVDGLFGPTPIPELTATLRVAVLYDCNSEVRQAAERAGMAVVRTSAMPSDPAGVVDFDSVPTFHLLLVNLPGDSRDVLEFAIRFLRVRRPAAFVLTGKERIDTGAESGQVSKPGCNCRTRTSAGNEHEVVTSTPGSVGAAQAKHEVVAINSVPSV